MNESAQPKRRIAIACGGTGGHLFPGLAVAGQLVQRGCDLTLMISPKEVDQQSAQAAPGLEFFTVPAIGLVAGHRLAFLRGCVRSYAACRRLFQQHPPCATLAMGGFTSAPPVLAAKRIGARTFLHESNTIPGRANHWLSWLVDISFVGFPCAAQGLQHHKTTVTGTPVRPEFQPRDAAACRSELGLDPARPVVLVMGGSQGAQGINERLLECLPSLARLAPEWQWIHLTGQAGLDKVREGYAATPLRALVLPFLARMELAMGAATLAISRAGASSLAELAAMRLPPILIPYPAATDDHQTCNARSFAASGAAILFEQSRPAEALARCVGDLMRDVAGREKMQTALGQWHHPRAAEQIAEVMLRAVDQHEARVDRRAKGSDPSSPPERNATRRAGLPPGKPVLSRPRTCP
jgi:UDP-N-acetylglucosamine--N-acetylmuramyl-(pentapeptide) pyrophosphoryl-undecaprenol N-acetylglucosamine transferase